MPYRPTERTEARRAETRERIAEAALAQLAEGGYASASVQAVAARAGVATGSVYRHFPSKAELFTEVFRRASGRELALLVEVAAADGRPARERIGAAVEVFARRALAGPQRAWALIAEPVDPSIEAERLVFRHGYRDVFKQVLEEGIEAGELPPHDTDTAAAALVGAIGEALVGPLSPAANGGGRRRHEALVAGLVQFCLNAIPAAERRELHAERPSGEEQRGGGRRSA
jgi:AcrR family transcriptional regulator